MATNNLAPPPRNTLSAPQTLAESVQQITGMDPNAERSNILPFWSKRTGWIAPAWLYQAAKAAIAPGFAMQGGRVTPEEAMSAAMTVGTGGMATTAARPAPANALGMFIGRRAKNWNERALQNAELLEKAGVSPEEIWRRWGTWRGPDGEWRQEISDAAMQFKKPFSEREMGKATGYMPLPEEPMPDLLSHPELMQAYPEFANAKMTLQKQPDWMPESAQSGGMVYTPLAKDPNFRLDVRYKTENPALSSAAHELQHGVQHLEGFAQGGQETEFYNAARKILESDPAFALMTKEGQQAKISETAFNMYRRLMGEAEARLTESRRAMTPEQRRAAFPGAGYDVPINSLIDSRKK